MNNALALNEVDVQLYGSIGGNVSAQGSAASGAFLPDRVVIGTVAGGALILLPAGTAVVSGTGLFLAVAGLWGAWMMPPLPAGRSSRT